METSLETAKILRLFFLLTIAWMKHNCVPKQRAFRDFREIHAFLSLCGAIASGVDVFEAIVVDNIRIYVFLFSRARQYSAHSSTHVRLPMTSAGPDGRDKAFRGKHARAS